MGDAQVTMAQILAAAQYDDIVAMPNHPARAVIRPYRQLSILFWKALVMRLGCSLSSSSLYLSLWCASLSSRLAGAHRRLDVASLVQCTPITGPATTVLQPNPWTMTDRRLEHMESQATLRSECRDGHGERGVEGNLPSAQARLKSP